MSRIAVSVLSSLAFALPILCQQATFAEARKQHLPDSAPGVLLADIDGDGDLDAVGSRYRSLLVNVGGGRFVDASATLPNDLGFVFATADLEPDGDVDLIASSAYGLRFFRNSGCTTNSQSILSGLEQRNVRLILGLERAQG